MSARALPRVCGLALALTLAACRHEPPPPSVWVATARLAAPPPLQLAEVPLGDHGAWNRLLDGLALVGGEEELPTVLQTMASRIDAAELARNPGARQLVGQAIYRMVRAQGFAERFEAIRGLVDRLQAAAPDAPETLFSRAFLRWVLLSDGQGRLALNDLDPAIVRDLRADLAALIAQHPTFDGPGVFDRRRLRAELAAVDILLATVPAAALPAAATPAVAPVAPESATQPDSVPATPPDSAPAAAPAAASPVGH